MLPIQRIAVGTDLSEASLPAVHQALRVARHTGAELVLVHAGPIPAPESAETARAADHETVSRRALSGARDQLEALRERLSGQGVVVSHVLDDAFPDTALAEVGDTLDAGLVVVGTHGRTGLRRILLGSVAGRVVRLSRVPVMVARGDGVGEGGYRRILVPVDFSPSSGQALALAAELAATDARVDVLHCWQLPVLADAYTPARLSDAAYGGLRGAIAGDVRERGTELAASVERADIRVEFTEVMRPAAAGIFERLDEGGHDLVVTGAHGRRGVRRHVLGSVSEKVARHAPCSAVVVHAPRETK